MSKRRLAAVALLATLTLAACGAESTGDGQYRLAEFSISGPDTLSTATRSLALTNQGQFPHTLVITDSSGRVVAATGLIPPGEAISLDIALDPGTYSFTCRIVAQDDEGNLIDHYESGMVTTVEVGA